jgi:hypothetical protein
MMALGDLYAAAWDKSSMVSGYAPWRGGITVRPTSSLHCVQRHRPSCTLMRQEKGRRASLPHPARDHYYWSAQVTPTLSLREAEPRSNLAISFVSAHSRPALLRRSASRNDSR